MAHNVLIVKITKYKQDGMPSGKYEYRVRCKKRGCFEETCTSLIGAQSAKQSHHSVMDEVHRILHPGDKKHVCVVENKKARAIQKGSATCR